MFQFVFCRGLIVMIIEKVIGLLDSLCSKSGSAVKWLSVLMVVSVVVVVSARLFGIGSIATQELVTYLHASLFMLGMSFALKNDGHVRVDIFYRRLSCYGKAIINLAGTLIFLLPICAFIFFSSWDYVVASWKIKETSSEADGIAAVYLLKTLMLIMPISLALQGISEALRGYLIIRGKQIDV